jgi:tetratricopeptide (TPR) repeat protein
MSRGSGTILAVTLIAAALSASAVEQDPLRSHHERAQSFQLAGELDRAEIEYRSEVLPRALRRLGNLSGAEGRIDESIALLEDAVREAPGDIEIQIDLAVAWLRKGDLARAGRLAGDAASGARPNARARSVSGRVKLLAGDAAQAAAELRQSLDQEPRFDTAFALALAHLHLRRLEAARALFDQMVVANTTADLRVLIGRAYLEANYPDQASEEFRRAGRTPQAAATRSVLLDLLPTAGTIDEEQRRQMRAHLTGVLEHTWHNLGVIYERRGETERAADARRRAAHWNTGGEPAASPVDIAGALRNAEQALQAGDARAAEHAIAPVIEQRPDLPAAWRVLGLARAAQGRYDEAEALLRKASDRDATEQSALVTLSNVYAARGEFARALATLDRVPDSLQRAATSIRLRAYLGVGRLADARSLLPEVAERAGPAEAADVADALLARNLTAEAEDLLQKIRQRGQSSARLSLAFAKLRLKQNESSRAEALLNEALSLDAGSVEALRLLAQVASARGDAARAFDLLRRARERAPDSREVLRAFAEASVRAARPEAALDAARRLAALQPDDADARHLLAVTLLQHQNWSEAIELLSAPPPAAAGDPRWPLALGMAEFGRRRYEAARIAFERALTLDSGQLEARYHLGLIAREQGRTAEAIESLLAVIARDPAHGPAHLAIGTLFLLTGDLGRAQRHLDCAVILNPEDPAPHYQLALLHRRTGDLERAGGEIQQFEEKRHKTLAGSPAAVVKSHSRKGGC